MGEAPQSSKKVGFAILKSWLTDFVMSGCGRRIRIGFLSDRACQDSSEGAGVFACNRGCCEQRSLRCGVPATCGSRVTWSRRREAINKIHRYAEGEPFADVGFFDEKKISTRTPRHHVEPKMTLFSKTTASGNMGIGDVDLSMPGYERVGRDFDQHD